NRLIHFKTSGHGSGFDFWRGHATWYIFLLAFGYSAIKRNREIKTNPNVYDFKCFSLYAGDVHPRFLAFDISGKPVTLRQIETLLEPGLFFVIGIALAVLGQAIGHVIWLSAVCYSLSYRAAWLNGDNFVWDTVDKRILAEQTRRFIDDLPSNDAKGVQ